MTSRLSQAEQKYFHLFFLRLRVDFPTSRITGFLMDAACPASIDKPAACRTLLAV
jgi:hypothetical protein